MRYKISVETIDGIKLNFSVDSYEIVDSLVCFKDFKTGLVIVTSATAGTITFFSGDYDGSIYGNYVVNPATNTTYIYNPDTFRFQEFDGDMFFKVEGLTSTKISLFTMP